MQTTIDSTSEFVDQASNQVNRSAKRLAHLLSFVPDDKLSWTPSSTSRSALRIVAHCALTNTFFANVITGKMSEQMPTPEELFKGLHEGEHDYPTRESAVALLNKTTVVLLSAIDSVDAKNIDSNPDSPFGPLPVRFWINQSVEHLSGHAGQLAYVQTLWGDLDNHMA